MKIGAPGMVASIFGVPGAGTMKLTELIELTDERAERDGA
jgi:hypothetical protein